MTEVCALLWCGYVYVCVLASLFSYCCVYFLSICVCMCVCVCVCVFVFESCACAFSGSKSPQ